MSKGGGFVVQLIGPQLGGISSAARARMADDLRLGVGVLFAPLFGDLPRALGRRLDSARAVRERVVLIARVGAIAPARAPPPPLEP